MRIGSKVRFSLIAVAIAITVCSTAAFYLATRTSREKALSNHLNTTARSRASHVETLLKSHRDKLELLAKDTRIQEALRSSGPGSLKAETAEYDLSHLLNALKDTSRDYVSITIVDRRGEIVWSSDGFDPGLDGAWLESMLSESRPSFITDVYMKEQSKQGVFAVGGTVKEDGREAVLGAVIAEVSVNILNRVISARTGLGKTGEVFLINRNGLMVTPSRFLKRTFLSEKVDTENTRKAFNDIAVYGGKPHAHSVLSYPNYMGTQVLGIHAHVRDMDWVLFTEISEAEALMPMMTMKMLGFVILCIASIAAWAIGSIVSHRLTAPIERLRTEVEQFGQGDIAHEVTTTGKDEIGQLSRAFDHMAANLGSTMTSVENLNKEIEVRKRTEAALDIEKDKVEAATEAKSQFLANMSHEMRTPMNAIIGFTEILRADMVEAEHIEYLAIIEQCCRRLVGLVNEILDLSKVEAGQLELDIEQFQLDDLLKEVEALLMPLANENGVDFAVHKAEAAPEIMCSDPVRLHQCLVNLVGNALKFTRQGHVYINVSPVEHEGKAFIRFDVEDTGLGISRDKQQVIFEAFTQADGSMTREYGGTGLGLTIVRHLTELLGGRITLSSEEKVGSVFSLVLPANLDVQCDIHKERDEAAGETQNGDSKAHSELARLFKAPCQILVAEDSKTNQKLMTILLERLGHQVLLADDGLQAVEAASIQNLDLIFMDMQMPNMSGYEAASAIRSKGMDVPIVALTAHAMKGDREKCIAAGCNDYMSKPTGFKQLLLVLNKHLPAATGEPAIPSAAAEA